MEERADLCLHIDFTSFKPQVLTSLSLGFLIYKTGIILLKTIKKIRENAHRREYSINYIHLIKQLLSFGQKLVD